MKVTTKETNAGWAVYVGGWRVAMLKTEAGANRRAEKERAKVAEVGFAGLTPRDVEDAQRLWAQGDRSDLVALTLIASDDALPAEVEYDLEDRGLIVQTDQPYADLTDAGIDLLRDMVLGRVEMGAKS
jgi:hypothetical protein